MQGIGRQADTGWRWRAQVGVKGWLSAAQTAPHPASTGLGVRALAASGSRPSLSSPCGRPDQIALQYVHAGIAGDLRFVFGFYAFSHHGGAQRCVNGADQPAKRVIAARPAAAGNQAAVEFDVMFGFERGQAVVVRYGLPAKVIQRNQKPRAFSAFTASASCASSGGFVLQNFMTMRCGGTPVASAMCENTSPWRRCSAGGAVQVEKR